MNLQTCPYVGVDAFGEEDRLLFYGRERDQEILLSNLYAAPASVLYGKSGVGKSSLLLAGLAPLLPKVAADRFPSKAEARDDRSDRVGDGLRCRAGTAGGRQGL